MVLRNDGSFALEGAGTEKEQEEEITKLFEFLCFLHVNAFWSRVEEFRGCRLTERPLAVEKADGWVTQSCGRELLARLSEGRELLVE